MMKRNVAFFCTVCILCSGCSWLGFRQNKPQENVKVFHNAKILNKERLAQGGNLLLEPFSAGPNVEANPQMDKVSYRILKGISDSLKGNKPYFNILLDEGRTVQESDLVFRGYITEMKKTSKIGALFGKNKKNLGVEGKLVDKETGEIIAVFSNIVEAREKEDDHKKLGLTLGEDIGRFIAMEMMSTTASGGE